jgi:HK97 family phage major capsid protein
MPETIDKRMIGLRGRLRKDREAAMHVALDMGERDLEKFPGAATELEIALDRVETLDRRLDALPISVRNEPDLYVRGGKHSFFADLAASANPGFPMRGLPQPAAAEERLKRHREYETARIEGVRKATLRGLSAYGIEARMSGLSQRALSNVAGAGAEFSPPKWIVEEWASVSRAAAPLKGLVTEIPLPPSTLELFLPRFVTAAGVVPMQAENVNAPDDFGTTDQLKATVATFTGDALCSQQLFDRGGMFADEIMSRDFSEAYAESLQQQLISGTGLNGQLLGLLNVPTPADGVPGPRLVTFTSATPSPSELILALAKCAGQISGMRKRPPSLALMRGSRYFWTVGSTDGSGNEPVMRPGTGLTPTEVDTGPYGPLAGLPIYHDNELPNELGTGKNQDVAVLVRAADVLLLEDPLGPRFTAYTESNAAGQLSVVLNWRHYASAFTNRYPSGIGSVQGTGLVVPSGF